MALPGAAVGATPHIVVLPYPVPGHINPLLQLSRNLAVHGISVTFFLSKNADSSSSSKTNGNDIPNLTFAGVPSENLSPDSVIDKQSSVSSMEENMEAGFRALIDRLNHGEHPVSAIIVDVLVTWGQSIADQFSLPCLTFFTSNATSCALFCHIPSLIQNGVIPFPRDENGQLSKEKVTGIPGVPDLLPEEFPFALTLDGSDPRFNSTRNVAENFSKNATSIILNTFQELEEEAVDALIKERKKKLFTVGPLLLLSKTIEDSTTVSSSRQIQVGYRWQEDEDCLPWLDKQAPRSVIYISLGSMASLTMEQFQEFAVGIEESKQAFLWVVRPDSIAMSLEEALPEGFIARTRERGLIITWGPQIRILSHSAIGAFLTHCGWNSIIENLCIGNGVPMLCWPLLAEQHVNRLLIVDVWKIGLSFQHQEDGIVSKYEVARVFKNIMMNGEQLDKLHSSATTINVSAKKAVYHSGSSLSSFQSLLTYLRHS